MLLTLYPNLISLKYLSSPKAWAYHSEYLGAYSFRIMWRCGWLSGFWWRQSLPTHSIVCFPDSILSSIWGEGGTLLTWSANIERQGYRCPGDIWFVNRRGRRSVQATPSHCRPCRCSAWTFPPRSLFESSSIINKNYRSPKKLIVYNSKEGPWG